MRYVAAYLLVALGGKASPTVEDIERVLGTVGVEANADRIKDVIAKLQGKNIDQLITEGREKLSSMPVGGAAAAPAAAGSAPAAAEEKKEDKKPEKKEESESEDDDMGFGLFD